jgi:hypothetical protein
MLAFCFNWRYQGNALINGFGGPGNLPSPDPFLPPERGALATVVSNVEVTDLHPTAISLDPGKWRRFRG